MDHEALEASEPGGGSGSLHDHWIWPPVPGGIIPEETTWTAAPTVLGPFTGINC